jgi:hypothetical protein
MSDKPSSGNQWVHLTPAIGFLYILFACVSAWQVIGHSNAAARYLKEAVQFLASYSIQHPLAIPTFDHQLKLLTRHASDDLNVTPPDNLAWF